MRRPQLELGTDNAFGRQPKAIAVERERPL